MFEFTINYSKDYKLYDLLITKDKKYYNHFHHNDILFIKDYIKFLVIQGFY